MSMNTSFVMLQQNTIKYMLQYVSEYEQVKRKEHPTYKKVREFFRAKDICFQNFYKFYNRYISSGRNAEALLPTRRGPKPKYVAMPVAEGSLEKIILDYRKQGYNKYIIAESLKTHKGVKKPCSASTVYRILRSYGMSRLTKHISDNSKEEIRKITRDYMGSLGHIDCHYLPKGVVKLEPARRYYVIGCIDDFSRIAWVEVIESTKAIDAAFGMMDIILLMNQRYGITFDEVLTDNGSEFCGSEKSLREHPFERLLMHFAIKHRKTKPYRPQTNGKIERFWRTFDEDVIDGTEFETLDDLKEAVLGYNFYYNELRPHQAINGQKPQDMIQNESVIFQKKNEKKNPTTKLLLS